METKKSRQEALEAINNSPKSHYELCRIAKKALKNKPKEKYKMKVFRQVKDDSGNIKRGKEFAELRASTKAKLKKSTLTFGNAYTDTLFTFGEIEPIK